MSVSDTGSADPMSSADGAAFANELYACHRTALMRLALHLTCGDRHRAEDLVQEVITRAWCRRDTIRRAEVRAWLAVTARHLVIDWHRRQVHSAAREQATVQYPLADDPADQVTAAVIARSAVAALPPHHRAVIVCLYWAGCTTGEAAAALGIPAGTVKSRTFHAMAALRASLAAGARTDGADPTAKAAA